MKRVLIAVPGGNGPGNGRKWNKNWPQALENAVSRSLWKLVTPGILVIAALTDSTRYSVHLVDEEFSDIDTNQQYDIVAFYTVTPNVKRCYTLAEYFRNKGAHIVLGGVHATVFAEEASRFADTLLIGEAENLWVQFLNDFEAGCPKILYKQPIGTIDINRSPIPAFSLIPDNGRRVIPVQTARGCPHGCAFCNLRSIYGNRYRTKTIERVAKEIEAVLDVNPRAMVYFTDDNLFCDLKRAHGLLDEIKKFNIIWYANSDLLFGKEDTFLNRAYKSGLRQVLIGFESVNPSNLAGIDESGFKNKNAASYKEIIARIQSHGIGVIGSFIIGLDGDDASVFERMAEFIYETNLYGASITVNTPYPGTVFYEKMSEENRILSFDWDEYTIFQPVIKPLNMTVSQLNEGYVRLLEDIHSTKSVLRRMKHFKDLVHNIMKG